MSYGHEKSWMVEFVFAKDAAMVVANYFASNTKINKTGVINDPLGQPTVRAGSDCRLILNFLGRTDGQHVQKQRSLPAVTAGRPRGSIKLSTKL